MKPLPEPLAQGEAIPPPQADWIELRGIAKSYGGFTALHAADLSVRQGEFLCLLGPSGCGKTTLLRILSGLEAQDAGQLLMDGKDIHARSVAARGFGIVFQSYALFPNLTVQANVAYGLSGERSVKAKRVRELLDLVGLPGTDLKYPAQLSGGQQQRVALARALANSPSLLLLDEPLSALDARVREHLRGELRQLQQKLGVTTVMVTHDQEEALALADRIAVMNAGRIEQLGRPEEIYREPRSRFVAEFVGQANWWPAQRNWQGTLEILGVPVEGHHSLAHIPAGASAQLFCRPEDLVLTPMWTPAQPCLLGTVTRMDFLGGVRRIHLSLHRDAGVSVQADLPIHDPVGEQLVPGQRVSLSFRHGRLRFFEGDA